jgi:hypothetical protein
VAGVDKGRDWEKEMKEVDKLLAKLPAADPYFTDGSAPTVRRPAAHAPVTAHGAGPARPHERLGTWLRVGMGVALSLGLAAWPYSHQCGLRLIFYMIGVGTVVLAGVWGALASWKRHQGLAHVLALGVTLWGLALAANVLLPRFGFTSPAANWICPDLPAPVAH